MISFNLLLMMQMHHDQSMFGNKSIVEPCSVFLGSISFIICILLVFAFSNLYASNLLYTGESALAGFRQVLAQFDFSRPVGIKGPLLLSLSMVIPLKFCDVHLIRHLLQFFRQPRTFGSPLLASSLTCFSITVLVTLHLFIILHFPRGSV